MAEKAREQVILHSLESGTITLSCREEFCQAAEVELSRATRLKLPFTVIYIVVDPESEPAGPPMKSISETCWGVSNYLMRRIRKTDLVARWNDTEFVVLLSGAGPDPGFVVLHKLREELREQSKKEAWPGTVHLGAITYLTTPHSAESLNSALEQCFRRAKTLPDGTAHIIREPPSIH